LPASKQPLARDKARTSRGAIAPARNHRRQSLHELQRRHDQVRGAVAPGCLLVLSGKLKTRESVVNGIENAPKGLIGLLKGENYGKQLVKLA
jgi:hypothetical protein